MGKILEAMLTNQLHAETIAEKRTPRQQKLFEKACELQERLGEKLSAEDNEILSELVDTIYDEACLEAEKKFERGYRLGVLTTAEIFMEQDMFLERGA